MDIYELHVHGMDEQSERYCTKSSVLKYCFLILLLLITVQISFNLSVQDAAFDFVSRWTQISEELRDSSTRLSQILAQSPKTIPSTSLPTVASVTAGVTKQHVELVCDNNATSNGLSNNCIPLCPLVPEHLVGLLATFTDSPSFSELDKLFPWVQDGGRGKPTHCFPRHRVAIIIPYRNRDKQLRTFLYNIHPILLRQELDYGIYVVEQDGTSNFNRAMLMNIGYTEAIKIHDYQCFIFHDVDLVPENDKNIYSCSKQPRHMSAAIDKFKYKLPYTGIFGGVSALSKEQFQKVNGFSNRYFGWGGEDDDMWNRIHQSGYKVVRYAMTIGRYRMIKHGTESGNKANPKRFKLLKEGIKHYKTDGLNSLKYKVLKIDYNHLFTRILVDINEADIMQMKKMSRYTWTKLRTRKPKVIDKEG